MAPKKSHPHHHRLRLSRQGAESTAADYQENAAGRAVHVGQDGGGDGWQKIRVGYAMRT